MCGVHVFLIALSCARVSANGKEDHQGGTLLVSPPSLIGYATSFFSPKFQGRVVYMCVCPVPKFSALMFAPY